MLGVQHGEKILAFLVVFLGFFQNIREEPTRLSLNHAFAWVTPAIFVIFVVFGCLRSEALVFSGWKAISSFSPFLVKMTPSWQGTKTRFTKNTVCATSNIGNEDSAQSFYDRSFWESLRAVDVRAFGSWISAPKCLFFSRILSTLTEVLGRDIRANDRAEISCFSKKEGEEDLTFKFLRDSGGSKGVPRTTTLERAAPLGVRPRSGEATLRSSMWPRLQI